MLKMNLPARVLLILTLAFLSLPSPTFCQKNTAIPEIVLPVQNLSTDATSFVTVGPYTIGVAGFNGDAKKPLWEGPIRIQSQKTSCLVPEGIVTHVYVDLPTDRLAVTAYSGSNDWVGIYSLTTCKPQ